MNGILIVDKPEGWTSHDVVAKLRGVLREKRIGHGGTLDPMATGVLPLFVGRGTRAVEFMEAADKEYEAGLRLGIVTNTQDTTGLVLEVRPVNVSEEDIKAALLSFLGESEQLPPLYSAIKVKGKKLYEYARAGKDVERSPREIYISKAEPLGWQGEEYRFRIVCSKGTYIRTICHDLGEKLGCGAAMSYLRRTRAGAYSINEALSLEKIIEAAEKGQAERLLRKVDSLFSEYPPLRLDSGRERICRNGGSFSADDIKDGTYRLYNQGSEFLALAKAEKGLIKIIKSFYEV